MATKPLSGLVADVQRQQGTPASGITKGEDRDEHSEHSDLDDDQLLAGASAVDEDDLEEEDEEKDRKVLFEVLAIGTFNAEQNGDLSFKAGEKMQILDSSHDDGWFLAENGLGQRGLIPGNYVQKVSVEQLPAPALTASTTQLQISPQRGKNLWAKVRATVKEVSLAEVLGALGAVPAGFRESTLGKLLLQSDRYHTSTWVFPKPSFTCVAFKDLEWNHDRDQVQRKAVSITRQFSIIAAKMIPLPGRAAGLHILSRQVRMAIFNNNNIISNIHTVRATWNPQEGKVWKFLPKNQTIHNSLFHRTAIIRVDSDDPSIVVLFELNITFKREKMGEIQEFSCGWSTLSLFDQTGVQAQNKTYELKVHGGTPFESGMEVDPALGLTASGRRRQSVFQRNTTPRLYVQFFHSPRDQRTDSSLLPSTLITNSQYVKSIGCFRNLVGQSFLRGRLGLPLPAHVNRPSLGVFLKALGQPDIMDCLLETLSQRIRVARRTDKTSITFVSSQMENVLLENIYPLLYSSWLPAPLEHTNEQRESERQRVIEKFTQKSREQFGSLQADTGPLPLHIHEQIFKII